MLTGMRSVIGRAPSGESAPRRARDPSDVEVLHAARVRLDELAPRLDGVAHQRREDHVGFGHVLDADFEERPRLRIHRRLPELLRVHLTEALVALDLEAFPRV